jgi:hypothetical protein
MRSVTARKGKERPMLRCAAVVFLVVALHSAPLMAQDTAITITEASADVYTGPTTITTIVGHVSRGTVLPVLRDLGSWVRVPWAEGQDGVGYLNVTTGRIGPAAAHDRGLSPSTASPAQLPTAVSEPTRAPAGNQSVTRTPQNVTTVSHVFGAGGLVAPMSSFGATARAWHKTRLGFQVAFTREVQTRDIAPGRLRTSQFEPGVVYALFDRVTDYVWLRPYVGSAIGFYHQTLTDPTVVTMEGASDYGIGYRVFAGTEVTLANVPRLALSADVGHRHVPTSFSGFERDPLSVSMGAHWYFR